MKGLLQAIGKLFGLVVLSKEEYHELSDEPTSASEVYEPKTLLTYPQVIAMLQEYDDTRLIFEDNIMMQPLKFEDTRMNTLNFMELKNYILYSEKLAASKGITLEGISFIKGVYTKNEDAFHNEEYLGYEGLMYTPTVKLNGEEVPVDLKYSTEGNIVTFKTALARNGYEWRYDKNTTEKTNTNKAVVEEVQFRAASVESGVGNRSGSTPPPQFEN